MSKAPLQLSEKDNRIYVKSTRKIEWRKKKKKKGGSVLLRRKERKNARKRFRASDSKI